MQKHNCSDRFSKWRLCAVSALLLGAFVVTQAGNSNTSPSLKVTGQWDFDQSDLRATVGKDMEYGDGPTGRVKAHTSFGTTTSFGIPDIGGKPAKVLKYTRDEFEPDSTDKNPRGYLTQPGLLPNGGGTNVNQFTMIVDMMIPDLHMGDNYNTVVKWEKIDDLAVDGSISIKANDIGGDNTGGIGISGQYTGDGKTWITGGSWQRLVVAVDMAAATPIITYYLDGVKFGQMISGDRWGFDKRHAIGEAVRLFGDGENDNEVNDVYVNSVQFRDGAMTAEHAAALGAASADGIPAVIEVPQATGAWNFDLGDLRATVGKDMEYGDGPTGRVQAHTSFGTTTSFGIPDIGGQPAKVMKYTRDEFEGQDADKNPRGYLTYPGLLPNGGGTNVNRFSMIVDMMIPNLHMGDNYNTVVKWEKIDDLAVDGSISIKANDIGGDNTGGIGISGQYTGDGVTWITGGAWQRLIVSVDMAAEVPIINYYLDGVKFGQMTTGDRWGFDRRHSIGDKVRLFGDGENDNEVNDVYVNSFQFRDAPLTAAQAAALGTATADGIPLPPKVNSAPATLAFKRDGTNLTLSWDAGITGFSLESTASLSAPGWSAVAGVVKNSVTVSIGTGAQYYRLKKP